jgi:hypothetical protein
MTMLPESINRSLTFNEAGVHLHAAEIPLRKASELAVYLDFVKALLGDEPIYLNSLSLLNDAFLALHRVGLLQSQHLFAFGE